MDRYSARRAPPRVVCVAVTAPDAGREPVGAVTCDGSSSWLTHPPNDAANTSAAIPDALADTLCPMTRSLLPWVALGAAALAAGCDSASLDAAAESGSLLAMVSPDTPAQAARDMVDPYSPEKRFTGTLKIANAPFGGEDVYLKIYREHLADENEDPGDRAVSAVALSLHGSGEDVPLILPLTKSPDKRVRLAATRSLQRLHNPVAIDPLGALSRPTRVEIRRNPTTGEPTTIPIPGEDEKDVRAAACVALGQYADARSLQALISATDDDDLLVSRSASDSLKTLTGQNFGDDRRAWVKWDAETKEPFAGRTDFFYPIFDREKYFWEYIPFVPGPPNETPGTPAGMPAMGR